MRVLVLVGLIAAAAVAPSEAMAATGVAPPGNSGIDQYVEAIPTTDGNRPTGGGSGDKTTGGLSPRAINALRREGVSGVAAATTLAALGGASASTSSGRNATEGKGNVPGADDDLSHAAPGQSAIGSVLSAAVGGGSGGMGIMLPLLMVAALIGACVVGVRRSSARS